MGGDSPVAGMLPASFLPRPASPVADPAAVGAEPKTARNYGALAMELGAGPEAARDVGQAMARNPVALIIPCHRVLAAGGKIGGFSAPGGSGAKIRMLALEGVRAEPPRPTQRSFAF